MASARDLTTLQAVKDFRKITDAGSDAQITRLVTAMSVAFVEETGCEVLRQSYTELFDGTDDRVGRMGLGRLVYYGIGFAFDTKQWPVVNVANVRPVVTVDDIVIPRRLITASTGWVLLRDSRLELVGFDFGVGIGSVSVAYDAGSHIPNEAATVPSGGPFTVTVAAPLGNFVSDIGVTKADGTVLTKVASAPAASQYSVNLATGTYTFAAADANLAVLISYSYLPEVVEDCVIEMVSYKMDRKTRLDHVSANMGGQSVSFTRERWPSTIQSVIDRWKRPAI